MRFFLVAAAALAAGYTLGRLRPGRPLVSWAERNANGGWRNPRNWAAQCIFAVALAYWWTVHPRRPLANVRSWQEEQRLEPAPRFDPNWRNR